MRKATTKKVTKKKKAVKETVKPAEEVLHTVPEPEGLPLCHCGRVVAPGQNQVCKDHIRIG